MGDIMRGKQFSHVSKERFPGLMEHLYIHWNIMNLRDIAKEARVEFPALSRYVGIIRDRSERRYGKQGRFKVLPRKLRIEQPSYVLEGIEELITKVEQGKLEMKK